MDFYIMRICTFRTQCGMGLVQTANKGYCQHFVFIVYVLCHFYACTTRFFRRGPVFVLLLMKFFRHSTSYYKVR